MSSKYLPDLTTTMSTTFSTASTALALEPQSQIQHERSPTTPRPNTTKPPPIAPQINDPASTPTRASFSLPGQMSLPTEPFSPAASFSNMDSTSLERGDSTRSKRSARSRDSGDMDMDGDDVESDSTEGSLNPDGTQSKKKKKKNTQKFFCTQYPPCRLSFTRSEHLARHIRQVASLN